MNKTISRYLSKNILYPRFIEANPSKNLGLIIVIPCYDEPDISASIQAIANCQEPSCSVEIIVSINAGEQSPVVAKTRNLQSEISINSLKLETPSWLKVYSILNNELPQKKAGVGLGRKIGMDEAVQRFLAVENDAGVIVCFDADSLCDSNYLREIESHFDNPTVSSASLNYAHPIEGDTFSHDIYESIIQYELHLRYFIRMQKKIKLPYAFHTVGSSMACTVGAYCAVGGMNQRKAGEDFYFIHKLVKFGKHSELNTTRVIPSPRISDRVPFGTGRAIGEMKASQELTYYTYHPQSFLDLKKLIDDLPEVYEKQHLSLELSKNLEEFLESVKASQELNRILKNTSDYPSFYKMFWHWFDAFVLMKYLHFVRDRGRSDILVLEAVNFSESHSFANGKEALIHYRESDLTPQ